MRNVDEKKMVVSHIGRFMWNRYFPRESLSIANVLWGGLAEEAKEVLNRL